MKYLRKSIFIVSAVSVLILGFATAYFFNNTEAQTLGETPSRKETSWRPAEIPLVATNSRVKLDLSAFPQTDDTIIGVKPVGENEREKMFAGVITWGALNEKVRGLVGVAKIDNYPQESAKFINEEIQFGNVLNKNQTLMIYLELKPSTRLGLNQAGESIVAEPSNESYTIFNGKRESANIKDRAFLITEMQMRKMRKEATAAGHEVRNVKEEK